MRTRRDEQMGNRYRRSGGIHSIYRRPLIGGGAIALIIVGISMAVGIWKLAQRLSDLALGMLLGTVGVITVVVVTAVLLSVKDLLQAYLMRRIIQDDRKDDLGIAVGTLGLIGHERRLPSPTQLVLDGSASPTPADPWDEWEIPLDLDSLPVEESIVLE